MSGEFERLVYAGGGVGLALLIEHLLCYDAEQFKKEPEAVLFGSNVMGVATIAIGYGVAKRSALPALEVIAIAAVGASVVSAIRIMRRSERIRSAVDFLAGRIEERIEGALTDDQEYARNGAHHRRT